MTEKNFLKVLAGFGIKDDIQALVIVDVDHFRALRNVHGAGAAECLLRILTRRLDGAAIAHGGLMIRLGSDEFAVLVPSDGCLPNVLDWAKSLAAGFPVSYRNAKFSVSVSAGLALTSAHCKTPVEALRCARQAVTHAKQAGGGTMTTCSARQWQEACDRDDRALELPGAIARGEMVPFYQPVVSLKTNELIGMEVLARWIHPKFGLLEPSAFIPGVEEHGLCFALTRALLQQVRTDARSWPEYWTFAFNTSPNELATVLDFIELSDRIAGDVIDGARVELEVTETAMMQDLALARISVALMRSNGVKVVLDDFGSGYANFNQLCQIPFSRLKIDKSLITHIIDDTRVQACAQAIIDLAHHLGMTVTAEGVESLTLAKRLAEMGCDHAQGFYFGRPVPADAISASSVGLASTDGDFGWAA